MVSPAGNGPHGKQREGRHRALHDVASGQADQALQIENRDKLWLTLAPFGALTITLVLVVFVGESVREAFDPKQYAKYE